MKQGSVTCSRADKSRIAGEAHGKGVVNAVLPVELWGPEHNGITIRSKHQTPKWRLLYFIVVVCAWGLKFYTEKEKTFRHAHVCTAVFLLFGIFLSALRTLHKINTCHNCSLLLRFHCLRQNNPNLNIKQQSKRKLRFYLSHKHTNSVIWQTS